MSLIIEDGTGKADGESYASVAEADAFLAAREETAWAAWAALATEAKEAKLRAGADYMLGEYGPRWIGQRRFEAQRLDWPRIDAERHDFPGAHWGPEIVPLAVKEANIALALKATSGTLSPDIATSGAVTEETVGPLSVKYASSGRSVVAYRAVDNALSAFLRGGSGQLRVVRVVRA